MNKYTIALENVRRVRVKKETMTLCDNFVRTTQMLRSRFFFLFFSEINPSPLIHRK